MKLQKWQRQYPKLRLLLNSQWRHDVISRNPAFRILFGILSVPGVDQNGNLKMAFCISFISIVGNTSRSEQVIQSMSSKFMFKTCGKNDSNKHFAFVVCVNTFVPSCCFIYKVKAWQEVVRFCIHYTSFNIFCASPIVFSICFR